MTTTHSKTSFACHLRNGSQLMHGPRAYNTFGRLACDTEALDDVVLSCPDESPLCNGKDVATAEAAAMDAVSAASIEALEKYVTTQVAEFIPMTYQDASACRKGWSDVGAECKASF